MRVRLILFSAAFLAVAQLTLAASFAKPIGYVNDFAGILQVDQRAELEASLKAFEQETSNEIAVAILDSFQGLDAFTASQQLFDAWKVGKAKRNNGILIVIGPREGLPFPARGEMFINVGKGLEGALPDALAGIIIRTEIVPRFKAGAYYVGIRAGVEAIKRATRGEYQPLSQDGTQSEKEDFIGGMLWLSFFVFLYGASFMARSKSWWLGSVAGGILGAVIGFSLWAFLGLIVGAAGAILGGLFDYVLSRNYQYRSSHGLSTGFFSSRGGFWRGGGRFGGGGGFGGFGGGGSGGGGGGGSW